MTDTPNPEVLPDMPLISAAFIDIMAHQFNDKLTYGFDQEYPDGTNAGFARHAASTLMQAQDANRKGQLTHGHLLIAQTYSVLSQEDDRAKLRTALVSLGSIVLDWIEQIDYDEDDE